MPDPNQGLFWTPNAPREHQGSLFAPNVPREHQGQFMTNEPMPPPRRKRPYKQTPWEYAAQTPGPRPGDENLGKVTDLPKGNVYSPYSWNPLQPSLPEGAAAGQWDEAKQEREHQILYSQKWPNGTGLYHKPPEPDLMEQGILTSLYNFPFEDLRKPLANFIASGYRNDGTQSYRDPLSFLNKLIKDVRDMHEMVVHPERPRFYPEDAGTHHNEIFQIAENNLDVLLNYWQSYPYSAEPLKQHSIYSDPKLPGSQDQPDAGPPTDKFGMGTPQRGATARRNAKDWNPNPWAVCTESVGREHEEKYERCVQHVKKKQATVLPPGANRMQRIAHMLSV